MKLMGKTAGSYAADLVELTKRRERERNNRRTLFVSIVAFSAIVLVLISKGLLSLAIITIPVSSFALYIVHARHQINSLAQEIELARLNKEESSPQDRYAEIIKRSRRVSLTPQLDESEHWTPLADRLNRSNKDLLGITILPKGSAERANTWEPSRIPVPRYRNSPKAAPRRRIDLTKTGVWDQASDERLLEAIAPTADQIFDQQLAEEAAEQIRTNRAANE